MAIKPLELSIRGALRLSTIATTSRTCSTVSAG
jgi:hypothetical protein